MIIALRTQFHVERPWGQRPFSIVSLLCLKCESASRRFQPGEVGAVSMIVKAFYKTHLNIKLYVIIKCDGWHPTVLRPAEAIESLDSLVKFQTTAEIGRGSWHTDNVIQRWAIFPQPR